MTTEVDIDQQANDEFLAGFNGDDAPAVPAQEAAEVTPVETQTEPEAKQEEPQEEPVLAGLTESQIKALLERSARVDSLEDQIRKANGKIGELNGVLQEMRKPKEPTQVTAPAQLDDAELAALESDFPEFARLINARTQKVADELKGTMATPDVESIRNEIGSELRREFEMRLMDMAHEDWRDVIASNDFGLWIATQPDEVRKTFDDTESAKELSKIVGDFKQWTASAATRSQRSKQRLESALTPGGVPQRTPPAKSEEDEFRAGFYGN